MSRVGKQPITIPDNVKVELNNNQILVEGPKGKETSPLHTGIKATIDNNILKFELDEQAITAISEKITDKKWRALHGLVRSLANNAIIGTTEGFSINLEIKGVGYRAQQKGKDIQFQLGFSHDVVYKVPESVEAKVNTPTEITVSGTSKEKVGQVAAEIRLLKKPEPYKGKGIRYKGEHVIMKAGKVGKK